MYEVQIFAASSAIVEFAIDSINAKMQARLAKLQEAASNWRIAKVDTQLRYNPPDKLGGHNIIATVYYERY